MSFILIQGGRKSKKQDPVGKIYIYIYIYVYCTYRILHNKLKL
jgi:hypothetical protein